MEVEEGLAKLIFVIATRKHRKYCDYPCFTERDVLLFIKCAISKEPFIERAEGTTVVTKAGSFGNVSYNHLVSCLNYAIYELKNILSMI